MWLFLQYQLLSAHTNSEKNLNLLKRDPLQKETIASSLIRVFLLFGVNRVNKFVMT
jgi:hypothetical protein